MRAFDDENWAEDHGYYHWKCRDCGRSGWTDTTPDCDCQPEPQEEAIEDEEDTQ